MSVWCAPHHASSAPCANCATWRPKSNGSTGLLPSPMVSLACATRCVQRSLWRWLHGQIKPVWDAIIGSRQIGKMPAVPRRPGGSMSPEATQSEPVTQGAWGQGGHTDAAVKAQDESAILPAVHCTRDCRTHFDRMDDQRLCAQSRRLQ